MSTKGNSEIIYASPMQRAIASAIDIIIVFFVRFLVLTPLGELWLKPKIVEFYQDFAINFKGEFFQKKPEHINFFLNHEIFLNLLTVYVAVLFAGAFYYAYLHSSYWQATIGKRVLRLVMIKSNGIKVSFKRALLYYFLSILPFIYVFYIALYSASYNMNLVQSITSSFVNIVLTTIFVAWMQAQFFNKKRNTICDMICLTLVKEGGVKTKYPWRDS